MCHFYSWHLYHWFLKSSFKAVLSISKTYFILNLILKKKMKTVLKIIRIFFRNLINTFFLFFEKNNSLFFHCFFREVFLCNLYPKGGLQITENKFLVMFIYVWAHFDSIRIENSKIIGVNLIILLVTNRAPNYFKYFPILIKM